jgi:predicted AlkP superfamily phosphohydrolase/phosphomutase
VILGFDGGDPDLIRQWAQEGYLPTVASIMRRGFSSRTSSPDLIFDVGVWVSLFSGIPHDQHGFYYLRQLVPGTYDLQLVTGLDATARPFWSGFSERKRRVAIVDVPDVYPQAGVPGVQLANWATLRPWATHHPAFDTSAEPPDLLRDAHQVLVPPSFTSMTDDAGQDQDRRLFRGLLDQVEKKGVFCRDLLARDRVDLAVVVFSESHAAGHRFWRYRPEAHAGGTAGTAAELRHALRDVYQAIDRQMGLLLKEIPERANVFVVSSVGLENRYPTAGLIESFCRTLGYQAAPDSAPLSWKPASLVRRTLPEAWRVALSRHLPRDTRERLLADQFRTSTNWQRTRVFAIPSFFTSFLRVNLRGREPQGIVEPGAPYDAVLDQLRTDLMQLVDPHTAEPAVERIARVDELFGSAPHPILPDLVVEWKPVPWFIDRLVHPRAEITQPKPEFLRGNDHSQHGFIAAAGPSIAARGPIGDVPLLDLAPTFLSLMDEPIPQAMRGQVIDDIVCAPSRSP